VSGSATNFGLASACFGDSADGGGVGIEIILPDWADATQYISSETTEINNKLTIAQTAVPERRARKQAERLLEDLKKNRLMFFMESFVVIEGI